MCIYYVYTSSDITVRRFCPRRAFGGLFNLCRKKVVVFGYKGHLLFTFALATPIAMAGFEFSFVTMSLLLFGSLLPDIDHRHAILGRFNILAQLNIMKHRGKCHTIIGSLLLSSPFILLGGFIAFIYVFIGCISHLVADKVYSYGKHKQTFTLRLW